MNNNEQYLTTKQFFDNQADLTARGIAAYLHGSEKPDIIVEWPALYDKWQDMPLLSLEHPDFVLAKELNELSELILIGKGA